VKSNALGGQHVSSARLGSVALATGDPAGTRPPGTTRRGSGCDLRHGGPLARELDALRVLLVLSVGERIAPGEDRTEVNDHTDNGHAHRAQTALRTVEADAR
jgi:hypothetical protein